jgi:hypothetical protein
MAIVHVTRPARSDPVARERCSEPDKTHNRVDCYNIEQDVMLAFPQMVALFGWLALLCACSSSSSSPDAGGAGGGCPPYVSTADLSTPIVSFRGDVIPIFRYTCALAGGSCHGDPSVVMNFRPFLGYFEGDAGPAAVQEVWSGLVGVKSTEDLGMNLVTGGDPKASFLMHKMDGDQCTLISECMVAGSYRPNCGVFMPYQAPTILDMSTRDTVRRWIEQGAADN